MEENTIETGNEVKKHVTFMLHKLPAEKYDEFKDFCHKVSGGNFATGLSFLLELAKVSRGISVLMRLIKELEDRVITLEKQPEEEEEVDMPKTLGGK